MRAIEATDLEHRVAKLEKLLAEAESDFDGNRGMPALPLGDLPSHFPNAKREQGYEAKVERDEQAAE